MSTPTGTPIFTRGFPGVTRGSLNESAPHFMHYLLIEHRDGKDPARVTIHATETERDLATLEAIHGSPTVISSETEKELAELRENGWLRFEGDPPLQWINAGGPQLDDSARLMFLWSLMSDPHGYGFHAIWVEHHNSARIANDLGLVLADVDMEEDDDDTEDRQGRTWRAAIDEAREKLPALKEGPGGYRPRYQ